MKYGKIVNGEVVQTQPYYEEGFVKIASRVVCGMTYDGENFLLPPVDENALLERTKQDQIEILKRDFLEESLKTEISAVKNAKSVSEVKAVKRLNAIKK